jgi:hypothetical protein
LDKKIQRRLTIDTISCVRKCHSKAHIFLLVTDVAHQIAATFTVNWLNPSYSSVSFPKLHDRERNLRASGIFKLQSTSWIRFFILVRSQQELRSQTTGYNGVGGLSSQSSVTSFVVATHRIMENLKDTAIGIIWIFKTLGRKSRTCTHLTSAIRQVWISVYGKPGIEIHGRTKLDFVRIIIIALFSHVELFFFHSRSKELIEPVGPRL